MRNLIAIPALLLAGAVALPAVAAGKQVIAHRGASGYLPEHTLEAYALAYGQGADFIEPDLVLSKDGHLIALHDIHLESTTDVEERFPDRRRADRKWYAADFTLEELKTLRVHERVKGRFPHMKSKFEIPTLEEVIELVQGLNATTGRDVGLYPELKQPTFHRKAGFDMESKVLEVLARYGYTGPDARVFVQCFEPEALRRIRHELGATLPLIQLISGSSRQRDLHTRDGLKGVAEYANGIGPDKKLLDEIPGYAAWAREFGLLIHPYTLRADDLPKGTATIEDELRHIYLNHDADAVFTDHPDRAVKFLEAENLR